MVEFMTSYRPAFDRSYADGDIALETTKSIEEPIIPISELGTTAIDVDGRGMNILQNLDKSIRMGAKKIQLIISGGGQGSPSMLASSYGKEVRQEVREKIKSTGAELTGVELSPSRVSGLAGFNQQQGTINEEQRQNDIRQVKYAIKFAADIAGGGGVDIWSNEFQRTIFDADWNKKGPGPNGKLFFDNNQEELKDLDHAQITKYLINERTGELVRGSVVRTDGITYVIDYQTAGDRGLVGKHDKRLGRALKDDDYVDVEGNYVDRYDPTEVGKLIPNFEKDNPKQFKVREMRWSEVEKETAKFNGLHPDKHLRTEEMAYRLNLLTQIANSRGLASYYDFMGVQKQIEGGDKLVQERDFVKRLEEGMTAEEKKKWVEEKVNELAGPITHRGQTSVSESLKKELLKKTPTELMNYQIKEWEDQLAGNQQLIASYRQQEKQLLREWKEVVTVEEYAKKKVFDSYAQAGKYAWQVTKEEKLKKPVYVGPEIGFAGQSYGGHPDEFIEVVKSSREEMAKRLMKEEGMAESSAKETAKKHIKGMLDTAHLTMWYKHFVQKPGETEEQKIKRFNEWTNDQVKKMVKEDVVGGVQIVDSITGEHAHLPPGQGLFDTPGMIKAMKEEGWDGPIVSEGHEEEQFQQGRILTETWRAFGSPVTSVLPGQPGGLNTWRGMQHSYFGYRTPHTYIVGAYSPSNDWQLWSEVPFE